MIKAILLSALALNVGMLLGRFSGFAREAVLASSLGVSSSGDVAVLMLSIPDLLVNILVGGGLAAALIPEFSERTSRPARVLLFQSLLVFVAVFAFVALVLMLNAETLVMLVAPGFEREQASLAAYGLGVVVWLIPLTVASGVIAAYLNAHNHFVLVALGTLILNMVIILGLLIGRYADNMLTILSVFILLGGGVRLILQYLHSCKIEGGPAPAVKPWLLDRKIIVSYLQVAGAGSLLLCFPVIARAFASSLGEGGVAQISYAVKLVELPLAVAVTFLSVVFFPRMSKAFVEDQGLYIELATWGCRITIFLSLIATASFIPIAEPVVQLVYGYGAMDALAVKNVAELFAIGILGLVFMGISSFVMAIFNARKDTRTPLVINVLALALLVALLLMGCGQSLKGIMFSLVLSYVFSGLLSVMVLVVKYKEIREALSSFIYIFFMFVPPLGIFILLPKILPNSGYALWDLLVAFGVAALSCVSVALLVFLMRKKGYGEKGERC